MNEETRYLTVLLVYGPPPEKPLFHEARDSGGVIAWDVWANDVHTLAVEQAWVEKNGFGGWYEWCQGLTAWLEGKALS